MTDPTNHDDTDAAGQTPTDEVRPRLSPEGVKAEIERVVAPVVAARRCEIVDIEYRREPPGWVLRLYVERIGHDPRHEIGGVGLEDCVQISRDVSTALDVADIIPHAFHLEVSSPGLDRPLTKLEHFRRFVGLLAKLKIEPPLEAHPNKHVARGLLEPAEGDDVRIDDEELGSLTIPWSRVQKAHLVYAPKPKTKPGKGPGKAHKQKKHPAADASRKGDLVDEGRGGSRRRDSETDR